MHKSLKVCIALIASAFIYYLIWNYAISGHILALRNFFQLWVTLWLAIGCQCLIDALRLDWRTWSRGHLVSDSRHKRETDFSEAKLWSEFEIVRPLIRGLCRHNVVLLCE